MDCLGERTDNADLNITSKIPMIEEKISGIEEIFEDSSVSVNKNAKRYSDPQPNIRWNSRSLEDNRVN